MLPFIVFSISLLIGPIFTTETTHAAKPSNPLKSNADIDRETRVRLYQRTLRSYLSSDPYPLIDLEISLDHWKTPVQLIEGMNRAGVALGAVTSAREETIKKALQRYPNRLIPLTTSATEKDWMQTGEGYLSDIKRQLAGGAFGIGKITWRPVPTNKAQARRAGESLRTIIRLATTKKSFLLLDMSPDDDALEMLERHLRASPEAKVIWTQAGRMRNPGALPGYGHGLLRALSMRHTGLLFTLTQDPPTSAGRTDERKNHLYDPGRAFSREWRALLEARVGHFTVGNDSSPATPSKYAAETLHFRRNMLEKISPAARRIIAYKNAWHIITNRHWNP